MSEKVLCRCGKKAVQDGMCEDCFGNWEAWQDELREEARRTERCR